MRDDGDHLALEVVAGDLDRLHAQGRVGAVGVVHDLLKPVVRDDVQPVDGCDARALAIRQTEAAADALLHERPRVGGPERHDGVEVGDVPALFEHVDVNDDLGRLVAVLDAEQLGDHRVFVGPRLARVHLQDAVGVAALEEGRRLDERLQLGGVHGVARDDEDERLDERPARFTRVGVELDLHALVEPHAVLELDALELGGRDANRVEVLPGDHRRLFHEAVVHGLRQPVAVDHVLEVDLPLGRLGERGRRQLEAEHRTQLVDGADAGARPVAVRLVHQEDEVVEVGQVVEIALADVLRQPLDAGHLATPHLAVDLRDVEDVDAARRQARSTAWRRSCRR